MDGKRLCIFTGNKSNFKYNLSSDSDDLHNWAKSVPCSKQYVEDTDLLKRNLNDYEMKLVELFYKQELAKLKVNNIEAQMVKIRAEMGQKARVDEVLTKYYKESEEEVVDLGHCLKCSAFILEAPGIGPFCPNKECDVGDDIFTYFDEPGTPLPPEVFDTILPTVDKAGKVVIFSTPATNRLTEEKKDIKIEKTITKKKGLWD